MTFDVVTNNDLNNLSCLQPDGWTDIVPAFEYYINSSFCYPLKTKIDGQIVGLGVSIIFGDTSWLAHIIVNKDFRNRGIGYEIVQKLLLDLKNESCPTCLLIATELGQPVYEKAGFKIVSPYTFFDRGKSRTYLQISKKVVAFHNEHYSKIMSLDRKISGENREMLLQENTKNAMVYIDNYDVKGFYLPGLGEGLIVAESEEAGIELMKLKLSKTDKAVIPSENKTAAEFLLQNGFVESQTKGVRMILGQDVDWQPEKIYSRIGGNFG